MTIIDAARPAATATAPHTERTARTRHYAMCEPRYFRVDYAINPWMDPSVGVDTARAVAQWSALVETYRSLGHRVELITPLADQPDMVFAANGAVCIADRAYGASFRFPERQAEAAAWRDFLSERGLDVVPPTRVNEGEGDFAVLGDVILAGTGFRTDSAAHAEAAEILQRPVITLELIDARFYHLDVALAVLDDGTGAAPPDIAYLPQAFSPASRDLLRQLFPSALEVDLDDAIVLGLNCVSDGLNVVLPLEAVGLAETLRLRGYRPMPVALDELLKSGGSVKCCTMEHHR